MELLNRLGFPAVVTDHTGIVRACNQAAAELYRCGRGMLVGSPLASGALVGNDAHCAELIVESAATGSGVTIVRLIVTDDTPVQIDVRATELLDADGRQAGVLVVFGDGLGVGLAQARAERKTASPSASSYRIRTTPQPTEVDDELPAGRVFNP